MTEQLSPSAQAVKDAFDSKWAGTRHQALVVALRAAAKEVFPINYEIIDNCQYEVPNSEREQILAIAAELDNV